MIPFNIPPVIGTEEQYIHEAIENYKICGDGNFTRKCNKWIEQKCESAKVLLTTSCTHAIEMAAILANIQPGDEVIMPSFTFVSTADAFVLRGAKAVFVDIRPDTMNIDETLIEEAVTECTKAIVPVHYAGISCEMGTIMDIAARRNLVIIEDAAQAIGSTYRGIFCGSMGKFGCLSFHETKNFSMGEGGALLIHDPDDIERAEIVREKGTNRSRFYRGEIDKYTWVDAGSSYLPSELNAAYLWAQLERFEEIQKDRMQTWKRYYKGFEELAHKGRITRPDVPDNCRHNAHMFYIKVKDSNERDRLIRYLSDRDIHAVFHYIPLHSSPAGKKYGRFHGDDKYTTRESERLLRLPMYFNIRNEDIDFVIESVNAFFKIN